MIGILLALAAGVCWGIGEVCTKAVLKSGDVGPITAVAVRCVVAVPLMVIVYLVAVPWLRTEPVQWYTTSMTNWLRLILGAGVIAGTAALVLFYASMKYADIAVVKPIAFCVAPATGVILARYFLDETVTTTRAAGVALVLLGVVLISMKPDADQTAPSPSNTEHLGPDPVPDPPRK